MDRYEIIEQNKKNKKLENSKVYDNPPAEPVFKEIHNYSNILEKENLKNKANKELPTVGITNIISVKIYVNGVYKFKKKLEKDLPLKKVKIEIQNEIKNNFNFLLPDGFIINENEEDIFSLEGILNEDKLYINSKDIFIQKNKEEKVKKPNLQISVKKLTHSASQYENQILYSEGNSKIYKTPIEIYMDGKLKFIYNKDSFNNIKEKSFDFNDNKHNDDKIIEVDRKLNDLKLNCKKLDNIGDLEIFLYPKINFSFREKQRSINIIVVGQTGSGKTTLLNAFLNYLLGVKYEYNFRFKLIHENFGISLADSQTRDVTLYNIRPLDEKLPLITVIDTPGFGDTGGLEKDKLISEKIAKKFQNDVSHINAICFVVQSTNSKLTINQKYIFNSIMDLFGEDIKENFIYR